MDSHAIPPAQKQPLSCPVWQIMLQMSHMLQKTMIKYSPYDNIENIDINLCGGDNIQVREGFKKKTRII